MNTEAMTKAKAAYEAYAKAMGISRTWEELTVKEAEAWVAAANVGMYWGPG